MGAPVGELPDEDRGLIDGEALRLLGVARLELGLGVRNDLQRQPRYEFAQPRAGGNEHLADL